MSKGSGLMEATPPPIDFEAVGDCKLARDCMIPMGQTSEIVAQRYGITREMQDAMAVDSHRKALDAQAGGLFLDEIVPVTTEVEDRQTGEVSSVTVRADEGPREGSTMSRLAKLRTVFKEDGTTTAGNASQVSDGAAAVLLMRRSKAQALGLPVMGTLRGFKVVGVAPDEMGVGPAFAIPALLESFDGIGIDDIDVFEINEAFASQAVYCVKKLGIPMEKVNPLGGAISLGHPLGCTGARQIATLLHQLKRTKQKLGVVSMCIGTGMGAAALFENEQL
jgi:acetyl-CoA acyltransferase 1